MALDTAQSLSYLSEVDIYLLLYRAAHKYFPFLEGEYRHRPNTGQTKLYHGKLLEDPISGHIWRCPYALFHSGVLHSIVRDALLYF
jgi:hypothetical protein